MTTFKGFINYGCLSAEYRQVYTAFYPASSAVVSDEIEITVPDGWELYTTVYDETFIAAPWEGKYNINDILTGSKRPCFTAYEDWKLHKIALEYKTV